MGHNFTRRSFLGGTAAGGIGFALGGAGTATARALPDPKSIDASDPECSAL
nr:twin-arginine translocation signal domain-containing protein [uncultured Rhodococcus sp.]